MNTSTTVKWMTVAVIALVLGIGGGAFILSYNALHQVGVGNGMPADWRGYIWPLLTDAGLTVFTLALLVAQITRQRTGWWVSGVVFLSLASMAYNVAHAPLASKTPAQMALTITVNIWPSLLLVMTTEALRHLVKVIIDRAGMVVTMTELGKQVADLNEQKADLERQRVTLKKQRESLEVQVTELQKQMTVKADDKIDTKDVINNRRGKLLTLIQEGVTSKAEQARLLEVSEATVTRDLVALNGKARALA